MYIIFAVIFFLSLCFILRKKSKKTIHTVLLIILFLNFSLHFFKQLFPPYSTNFPTSLRRSTVENICAVSTVSFPFIFLFKKQNILHDYMFFIGFCGGLGAFIYPTEAINMPPFIFDVIRFYTTHTILIVVPLTAAVLGLYRPRLNKFWVIPLLFLAQETIICLNEFFLIKVGFVDAPYSKLLDPSFRNSSLAFGLNPRFSSLSFLFDPLVPYFFKTDVFHLNGGKPFYFPVLWLIGPAFVYLIPTYIIISSPFWLSNIIKKHYPKKV